MTFNSFRSLRRVAAVALAGFAVLGSAWAEVSPWRDVPHGQVRTLVSGQALGVEVDLDPGWKIYWAYAGPVGQPTLLVGEGMDFFFPWPKRGMLQGYPSYGYEGRTVFPGVLHSGALRPSLHVGLAICSPTQCIPHRTRFDLNPDAGQDALVEAKLRSAFAQVSRPVQGPITAVFDAQNRHYALAGAPSLIDGATDFLLEGDQKAARAGFFLGAARVSPEGQLYAPFDIHDGAQEVDLARDFPIHVLLPDGPVVSDPAPTRTDRHRAYQDLARLLGVGPIDTLQPSAQGTAPLAVTLPAPAPPGPSILAAAALLFLGGLALNIMPCVLPILFLKLNAVLRLQTPAQRRGMGRSFAGTAVGIVATFLILGATLALFQASTGTTLSLGAWMQFPQTTVALAALMVLFIANAFGWFDFVLPGRVANLGAGRTDWAGDVLAGVVAALMGGACAGVLLAAALAVAFQHGGVTLVILLGFMGLGLALPYILVAALPAAARFFPRPGPWLRWVKPLMGAGLVLTLAYLLFVATRQLMPWAVIGLLAASLIALALLRSGWGRGGGLGLLVLVVLALPRASLPPEPLEIARNYQNEINQAVARGERVLVDVTAYWCATCLTNKALVLDRPAMQTYLEETGTYIFTINADVMADNVRDFMAAQGRHALPLNVLFSPRFPDGEILPSVLTKSAVRAAVARSL